MKPVDPEFDSIQQAFQHTALSVYDIWIIYFSLGGTATASKLGSFLIEGGSLEPAQQRILAQSVNEVFIGAGLGHVAPYPKI